MEATADETKFAGLVSSFKDEENNSVNFVPVFVSLSNVSRIEALVHDAGGGDAEKVNDDGKESICCMLRRHRLVDAVGGDGELRRLKAMIVFDEADQIINGNVDQSGKNTGDDDDDDDGGGNEDPGGAINKKTQSMFMKPRTVGRPEDGHGDVVTAPCLFDLFTATLDVTATPYSLFFSGRDLKPRTHTGIITGSPSKHGFQYVKRPNWESRLIDCVEVPRDDGGVAFMIDDMVRERNPKRSRFAAVIDKTTRQKVGQRAQALRYAARYGNRQLITSTWSADGVSVFVRDSRGEDSDAEESSDSGAESDCEMVGTDEDALALVHNSFNAGPRARAQPEYTTMYQYGTEWHTAEGLESTIRDTGARGRAARMKEAVDAAKASAETTATGGEGSPLLYVSTDGEWELWETETSLEARVQGEDEQNVKELIACVQAKANTSKIAEYKQVDWSYPDFIDRFHKEQGAVSNERQASGHGQVFVNAVVFGKDIMDRGVTVKGARSHKCSLTDMYVGVDSHCTLVIQVCGRLCGNSYHKCDKDTCPPHGEEVRAATGFTWNFVSPKPPPQTTRPLENRTVDSSFVCFCADAWGPVKEQKLKAWSVRGVVIHRCFH